MIQPDTSPVSPSSARAARLAADQHDGRAPERPRQALVIDAREQLRQCKQHQAERRGQSDSQAEGRQHSEILSGPPEAKDEHCTVAHDEQLMPALCQCVDRGTPEPARPLVATALVPTRASRRRYSPWNGVNSSRSRGSITAAVISVAAHGRPRYRDGRCEHERE